MDEQTGTDPDLREELLAMIRSVEGEGEFLEPCTLAPTGSDLTGSLIGGYELRRLIATGGMGAVYEAEQAKPRRLVALKLLKSSFPSRSARRRFEFEAELLARLDHPGVARVYEAGVHEGDTGNVPYFAMELILGAQDIATHCDEHNLSLRERVELCAQVADAVEHGHQRGVLHRDLKPGNVLVGEDGKAKVIDFGVARATNQDPGETVATMAGEIVGTLSYMSPEQTMGDPILVDVRSDVYALGGLLHRLLTGKAPHAVQGLGVAEALRVVQELPVPAPSKARPELTGDLETVLLGALEKSRDERYATVNALAEDLRRWLRSEPIQRTAPSTWHRTRLFLRRNKKAAMATAAFVVVLVSATAISIDFGLTAQAALEQERKTSTRSDEVSMFLEDLLAAAQPMSQFGREALVSDVLAEATARVEAGEIDDPDVEAEVRAILGGAYFALGDYDAAQAQYERMEELWDTVSTARPEFSARHRIQYGRMLSELAPTAEARALFEEARDDLVALHGEDHPEVWFADEALSTALRKEGRNEEAVAMAEVALAKIEAHYGDRHHDLLVARDRFCQSLMRAGHHARAIAELEDLIAIWVELRGEDHMRTLWCRRTLGDVLTGLGRPDEALVQLRPVMAKVEEVFGPAHVNTLTTRLQIGRVRLMVGEYEEAQAAFDSILAVTEGIPPIRREARANIFTSIARLELVRGDGAAAKEASDKALEAWLAIYGEEDYRVAKERLHGARALELEGRAEEAMVIYVEEIPRLRATLGDEHVTTLGTRIQYADCLRELGELERALEELEEVRPAWELTQGELHAITVSLVGEIAVLQATLGQQQSAIANAEECVRLASLNWNEGHYDEAAARAYFGRVVGDEVLLTAAYDQLVAQFGPRHPRAKRIAGWMGDLLRSADRDAEAEDWESR